MGGKRHPLRSVGGPVNRAKSNSATRTEQTLAQRSSPHPEPAERVSVCAPPHRLRTSTRVCSGTRSRCPHCTSKRTKRVTTLDSGGPNSCRWGDLNSHPLRGLTRSDAARAGRALGVMTRDAPRRPERDRRVMLRSAKCPRESAKREGTDANYSAVLSQVRGHLAMSAAPRNRIRRTGRLATLTLVSRGIAARVRAHVSAAEALDLASRRVADGMERCDATRSRQNGWCTLSMIWPNTLSGL